MTRSKRDENVVKSWFFVLDFTMGGGNGNDTGLEEANDWEKWLTRHRQISPLGMSFRFLLLVISRYRELHVRPLYNRLYGFML